MWWERVASALAEKNASSVSVVDNAIVGSGIGDTLGLLLSLVFVVPFAGLIINLIRLLHARIKGKETQGIKKTLFKFGIATVVVLCLPWLLALFGLIFD